RARCVASGFGSFFGSASNHSAVGTVGDLLSSARSQSDVLRQLANSSSLPALTAPWRRERFAQPSSQCHINRYANGAARRFAIFERSSAAVFGAGSAWSASTACRTSSSVGLSAHAARPIATMLAIKQILERIARSYLRNPDNLRVTFVRARRRSA